MSEDSDTTDFLKTTCYQSGTSEEVSVPIAIGRYQIQSVLGAGAFGTVYGAFDSQLLRRVAVKVPSQRRIGQVDFRAAFLAEARTLARLDHPHIVPVYDFGSTDEYPCYIVSKYIDGQTLTQRISTLDWNWKQRAELVVAIADALHCAHLVGLVHRDVTPSNILLDQTDKAYLADFGLALSDEDYDFSRSGDLVGTLMYMSPEQVRGEGHLVDGRADVFSLGVVMYELLTGVRPFQASTQEHIKRNILDRDAKPLRQRNESVPRELERICLRALERRKSQRYSTALDFADELRAFVASPNSSLESSSLSRVGPESSSEETAENAALTIPKQTTTIEISSGVAPQIVPKGLRAFEAEDADFYLHILPGPKDRLGIPETLRFWKRRIEATSPEESFRAGVVYGPSGCGKSSLVRAGLLPLLDKRVLPIVVSATSHDTEERLQRCLAVACPEMAIAAAHDGLIDMLQTIRLSGPPASERIVLLVIDQFEQWLSQHGQTDDSSLIHALRQCDGIKLKCLFLVRNDFWMSISRVMEQLESPIEQGRNSAAVELFDLRHAQRVLLAFGQAYDALPKKTDDLTGSQLEFLEQSISQLAEDGRVICVRLAVYAQMIRDKVWEPKTLAEFGGVRGLGARFLEETFYGAAAPPEYKRFQASAREVLRSLLPTPGSNIRGAMLSEPQLKETAGQGLTDNEFKQLLRLLNDELRLLTPTDALGSQVSIASEHSVQRDALRYYQLTHDYLVPSLRTWLNAKQRETASGRAQLCLEERTALWEISRESRQLPSWLETIRILAWTRPSYWTASQSRMMAQAKRMRVIQTLIVGTLVLVCVACLLVARARIEERARQDKANQLVEQLFTAKIGDVAAVVMALDGYTPACDQSLAAIADASSSNPERQMLALLALSRSPDAWTERLLDVSADVGSGLIELVRLRIHEFATELEPAIRKRLDAATSPHTKLRYAAILPGTAGQLFPEVIAAAADLCEGLLDMEPQEADRFADYLVAMRQHLSPILVDIFHDPTRNDTQRDLAARLLAKAEFADEPAFFVDAAQLTRLLLSASPSQHFILLSSTVNRREEVLKCVRQELQGALNSATRDPKTWVQIVSNGITTLLRLAPDDSFIGDCLAQQADNSARTAVLLQCHNYGVPLDKLWEATRHQTDPVARQALILAYEPYHASHRPLERIRYISDELQKLVNSSPHQAQRSAAQWVLQRWGMPVEGMPAKVRQEPDATAERNWWVTPTGHTMVILTQPVYAAGQQALIFGRKEGAHAGAPIGYRRFAISATEVSRADLKRFDPEFEFIIIRDKDLENDACPANKIRSVDAMRYCRWLSLEEGFDESEMCYPPEKKSQDSENPDLHISDDTLNRKAYRLPTEAEWEFACHAGSRTAWSHGEDEKQLVHFGWHAVNSSGMLHPVGTLMPNPWGLFDMHGNIAELCHPDPAATSLHALRGGYYSVTPQKLQTRDLYYPPSNPGYSFTGFRIARTISITPKLETSHEHP